MENSDENDGEADSRRLVVAITDFLRNQLIVRTDLVPEDQDCLEIAIQCLEMAYGLEADRYVQYRFARPLLDVFNQVTNPVSIQNKLQADAHKDEGNAYMLRNDFSNAETEYSEAIELDRWNAIYYCNRVSARIEQHHYFEAISDCRQALMLNPDYAKAHSRMGQAYALIHRPRDAARCFRQALQLDPSNERYRNNVRVAESQIDRPDAGSLLANLLSSIFGALPNVQSNSGSTSTITLPTSFMIITESHPPIRQDPPEDAQPVENSQSAESTEDDTARDRSDSSTEAYNIIYPPLFGVIDEGTEEESVNLEVPTETDNMFDSDEILIAFFSDSSIPNSRFETEEVREETEKREHYSLDRTTEEATEPGEIMDDSVIGKVPPIQNNKEQEIDRKLQSVRESTTPGIVNDNPVIENGGLIQEALKENQTTDDKMLTRSEGSITNRIVEESESLDSAMQLDELQKLKGKYTTDAKTAATDDADGNFWKENTEQEAGPSGFEEAVATERNIETDKGVQRAANANQEIIDNKMTIAGEPTHPAVNEDSVSENGGSCQKTVDEKQMSDEEMKSQKDEVTVSGLDTKSANTSDRSTDGTDKQ